jgi:RimJ/RimL family protein N-acetyltransferase
MRPVESYLVRSQRLGLRPWAAADLDLAIGLWCDPEVTRWIGGPFNEGHAEERLAAEIACMETAGVQYWPVFLLATAEHIGCCGLRPYEPEERVSELGFHIRRAHWGRGYATEAARAVIGYAFDVLEMKALFAGHHPDNRVSQRVLERLGFRYTHEAIYPPTGLLHLSYRLTAAEALAAQSSEFTCS